MNEFQVCAATSKGKGMRASCTGTTAELGKWKGQIERGLQEETDTERERNIEGQKGGENDRETERKRERIDS